MELNKRLDQEINHREQREIYIKKVIIKDIPQKGDSLNLQEIVKKIGKIL